MKRKRLRGIFESFLKESRETSLLQSPQLFLMQSTWPVNWSSKQFRVELQELVKAIKGSGKTTKETPTTTTTATATTTISTSNRTGDRRLLRPMWKPQLRVGVMLGIYQGTTVATLTTMDNALQSVGGAKELVIRRKTAELGFQNSNVVTGTFLVNDHYACILFDSGAEKSFVSTAFTPFIDIAPAALDTSYEVELADGKVVLMS
ncbi:hypothetical protein Tco_0789148 [Tanacetum coccineum]